MERGLCPHLQAAGCLVLLLWWPLLPLQAQGTEAGPAPTHTHLVAPELHIVCSFLNPDHIRSCGASIQLSTGPQEGLRPAGTLGRQPPGSCFCPVTSRSPVPRLPVQPSCPGSSLSLLTPAYNRSVSLSSPPPCESCRFSRTSLMVQWLRLCVPKAGIPGFNPSLGK